MKTLNGIDNTESLTILKGKKLGLITNPTGMNAMLRSTAEILKADYDLCAVYGPEHGIRGDQQAGIGVQQAEYDEELGVRCFSLYGKTRRPTPEMLEGIEMMVYDIQDVGARFYTYIYTLAYAMEECAKAGIPVTILDRVNPLGGDITEGILLNPVLHSFVGEYPIPSRYGLTVGEFARYINDTQHIGCELNVIPCLGWNRSMLYDETGLPWIMPSPNIPTLESALVYIGTCLFEGTDLSEGRGTTHPFELIGAPQLDASRLAKELNAIQLPGLLWRAVHFTPTFSKHQGELCHGVQLHITDKKCFRPFEAGLYLLDAIRQQYPEIKMNNALDRLLGDTTYRAGQETIQQLIARANTQSNVFLEATRQYWLYHQ